MLAIGKQHLPSVAPLSLSLSLSLFYLVGKAYGRIDTNILEAPKNRVPLSENEYLSLFEYPFWFLELLHEIAASVVLH